MQKSLDTVYVLVLLACGVLAMGVALLTPFLAHSDLINAYACVGMAQGLATALWVGWSVIQILRAKGTP